MNADVVTLQGGLVVALPALRLALNLEARGLHLDVEGDALVVAPRDRITDADRLQIRTYRDELKAIAVYRCPEIA
jgi:hypothetical protein